jgi:hypothetical protein
MRRRVQGSLLAGVLVAMLAAVLLVPAGAGARGTTDAKPPYARRLQLVEALATRYPGLVERGNPYGRFGLWAGIVVQTTWQQRTHRDRIPLWALANYQLTVESSTFANLLDHTQPGRDATAICATSRQFDACHGWVSYFLAVRQQRPAATLLKLLWQAHTTAIVTFLRSQHDKLDAVHTTTLERHFWASWIEIVFLLQATGFPTDAATSTRASALLMPPCSPLGTPGCQLTPTDLRHAYPFVAALALHPATIDAALAEYQTLRNNPAATTTLAFTDPALAAALKLYLAAAH